jgi:plastocyanin
MRKPGFLLASGLFAAAPVLTGANVTIDNFSFGPGQIIVATGTRVTWANQDDIPHTVTDAAEQRDFKSPPLDDGEHFEHVFTKPGTYHYFCSLHPKMQGTIIVK